MAPAGVCALADGRWEAASMQGVPTRDATLPELVDGGGSGRLHLVMGNKGEAPSGASSLFQLTDRLNQDQDKSRPREAPDQETQERMGGIPDATKEAKLAASRPARPSHSASSCLGALWAGRLPCSGSPALAFLSWGVSQLKSASGASPLTHRSPVDFFSPFQGRLPARHKLV